MSQLPVLIRRDAPRQTSPESAPIIRVQEMIFEEAAVLDASDIHIEPTPAFTRIRYRVNGILLEKRELPRWMHDSLVVRIKVLAKMDISERRLPQDGHIPALAAKGLDIRVSVIPTTWGEKVVVRMLRRARSLMTLSELGCSPETAQRLQALVRRPQGMLLVVGPTGSGKTTTLYALINEIRQEPLNIVTIEDPVEFDVERVTQVQVHEKAGLTFGKALRSILRQDPDVILVGEIRDSETARTAFHAAMTGHLVLSTVHATDAISALLRVRELGLERGIIAATLMGVVGQRLVRENCASCSEQDSPPSIYVERLGIAASGQSRFRRSAGCSSCGFEGSRGRVGLYELLELRGAVRRAIEADSENAVRKAAAPDGFVSLTEQAVRLVVAGRMPVQEAYRTCYFGGE